MNSWQKVILAQQEPMQKPRPLTYEELRALWLQREGIRSQQVKNFITNMLKQDGDAIQVAHQKEFNKLVATLEKIDAQQQELQRQNNEELKERYSAFFKGVTQNLPQKGRHQDYSSYNQQFRQPIQRR